MRPVLDVKNLSIDFSIYDKPFKAVDNVSFIVPEGSTVALVGESGSGKSTCCKAILQILPSNASISQGEIIFHDKINKEATNLLSHAPESPKMRSIRGGRISMIFQEPMVSLSPVHTIGDQISEAALLHRDIDKPTALELTKEILSLVRFPEPSLSIHRYPFELSGGLRQRAMIAMALICHPALLIADEPTTALDVTIQAQILELLYQLQKELQMSVLLVTHDMGIVANNADYVYVMYQGEVMESGPTKDLFLNPQHDYLKGLLTAVPRLYGDRRKRLRALRQVDPKIGHFFHKDKAHNSQYEGTPLLELKNVSKTYYLRKGKNNYIHAVKNLDLTVNYGECLGLVGESGCGKTTLSKLILKALQPTQGKVLFHGRKEVNLQYLSRKELFKHRKRVQYIFQDPYSSLNPKMTVYESLTEALTIHKIGTKETRLTLAKELLELVGLQERDLSRYPDSFSGGQRQRIAIARSLALHPELVICDEPVSSLDVSIQAQVLNLLKDLQKQLNLTYLFISHNLAVVKYMANRIAVMCKGEIVELASTKELFHNPIHPYTKTLLDAIPTPEYAETKHKSFSIEEDIISEKSWPDQFHLNQDTEFVCINNDHYVRMAVHTNRETLNA